MIPSMFLDDVSVYSFCELMGLPLQSFLIYTILDKDKQTNIFWYGYDSAKNSLLQQRIQQVSQIHVCARTTSFWPPSKQCCSVGITIPLHERLSVPKSCNVNIAWRDGERSRDKQIKQRVSKMRTSREKHKNLRLLYIDYFYFILDYT